MRGVVSVDCPVGGCGRAFLLSGELQFRPSGAHINCDTAEYNAHIVRCSSSARIMALLDKAETLRREAEGTQ